MGPRGKRSKAKQRQNSKQKRPPQAKRKKFSIHKGNSQHQRSKKRSYQDKPNSNFEQKRPRFEAEQPQIKAESSSEEEEEDHMKQLLSTFGSNLVNKRSVAIESSEDSESENNNEQSESESEIDDNSDSSEEKGDIKDSSGSSEDETTKGNPEETVSKAEPQTDFEEVFKEEDEVDVEAQNEDERGAELQDPFVRHLFYEMNDGLLGSVQNSPMVTTTYAEDWPVLGQLHIEIPKFDQPQIDCSSKFSITEQQRFAPGGTVPLRPSKSSTLDSVYIKTQIVDGVANANCSSHPKLSETFPLTPLQSEIFSVINNYQDFYYAQRTFENAEEIRFVYSLHLLNHVLKTRSRVLHHNARLNRKDDVPEEFRDQGLVRPKVLVIVPFRDAAYRIISTLIDVLVAENNKGTVMNKNRFLEEFTGHELTMPKKNPKPEDYEQLFAGNTGDDFRIGITVTKKSLKLFADFYSSDIIIASPLGLRTIIGADGEPDRDYDFLASIELLVLDQTELFVMQNWDHLLHVLNHMHLQPKESHGTDFARVRTWNLNGWSKYYRQTLIFSSVVLPEINAIFNKKCSNYAGKVKVASPVAFGAICQVLVQLPHVFHKFSAASAVQSMEARYKFFTTKILPQQRDGLMRQTLVFVSNYFDYVRLRNYFKKEDVDFVQVCEYSKEGKVARARDMFFHGDAHFLLYTERYHFFNRVRVKGIRHLVFYQPPIFPHFYHEMCNLMLESNMNKKIGSISNMTVNVLYSKYDVNQLSAIVGTDRAVRMIQSDRNVHMLVTDGK